MSYDANVIRFLRQKTVDGFDNITWLGAEQRFVAPARNSNLNNLEEQLILGTDTYTIEYTDGESGNTITTTCYCSVPSGDTLDEQTDYYKLVTTVYAEPQEVNDELYTSIGQNSFSMHYAQNGAHSVVAGGEDAQHPDSNALYYENSNDLRILNEEESPITGIKVGLSNQGFKLYKKSELFFVNQSETILIAEKHTLNKADVTSLVEGQTASVTKEIIINHLQNS